MGPTNIALVKLFQADQKLREAESRLEAASRNVRVQERRVADLSEKARLAHTTLREQQSKAGQLELDIKSRDAHIEKLRNQQQQTKNNKEYQTFLIEINTAKVDRGKVEDETMQVMETVEKSQAELAGLNSQLEAEKAKLDTLKAQSDDIIAKLKAEVESLRPARDAAAAAVAPRGREAFDRLAGHYEGESLAPLTKPDRRREEYVCGACNMDLMIDVYNKLHSRDELVFCPNCRRMLYIPEDLPPEAAIKAPKATPAARKPKVSAEPKGAPKADDEPAAPTASEPRAKGRLGDILTASQGESVRAAKDADHAPVECQVTVDGQVAGIYKGKTAEHLERVIRFRLEEAGTPAEVQVTPTSAEETEEQPQEVNSGNSEGSTGPG